MTMPADYDGAADARAFLDELFGIAEDGFVALTAFANGNSGTHCVPTTSANTLADVATQLNGRGDIYVRLTTMRQQPERGKRGGADLTLHGMAIPVDLDMKDGWTDELRAELDRRLDAAGLSPTVWVASGHGWHAYLLYDEPFTALDHATMLERAKATMLRLAGELGRAHGIADLAVDPKVYDAARVMRLPGTLNVKTGQPEQCYTMSGYGDRFGWSELDEALDPAPQITIERRAYAVGGAEDPHAAAPGREFNANVDGAEVFLELFPGFYVTHVDGEGNVYIARPDRRNHGVVRYADDGHIAIYSATTLAEMGLPPGHPDHKEGPWWPFNLLAIRNFGGVFSDAAKFLTGAGWHGQTYGTRSPGDAPATEDDMRVQAELFNMLAPLAPQPAPPQPQLTVVPDLPEHGDPAGDEHGDDEPQIEWGPGRIAPTAMLEAFGLELAQQVGQMSQYRATMLDGGASIAATVQPDGTTVLSPIMALVMPGAPIGLPLDWRQLFTYRFGVNWPAAWQLITGPDELPVDAAPIARRLRDAVEGIEGVGKVEPEPYAWATADEIIVRPKPPATLLARNDGACLLYERRISTIFGASETTKTWLCAVAALDCIRRLGRPVMWLDIEEPGNSQGAYRLAQLGATPEELRMLINLDSFMPEMIGTDYGQRYVNKGLRDKLLDKVRASDVGLIVVDSFSELAGSQDLDDNQKRDVTYLRNHLLSPLSTICAVFIIDHVGHATGAREAGSVNKRNAITGVRLFIEQTSKFGPGRTGVARLWLLKDRHSKVVEHCTPMPSQFAGETKQTTRDLAAVFKLWGDSSIARTLSDDEQVRWTLAPAGLVDAVPDAVDGAGRDAAAQGTGQGRETTTVDLLVEMRLNGHFSSQRNAEDRMAAAYGTGKVRVRKLLEIVTQPGGGVMKVGGMKDGKTSPIRFVLTEGAPNPVVEAAMQQRRQRQQAEARAVFEADLAAAETDLAETAVQATFGLDELR